MVLVSESVASHHEWSKGAIARVTAAGRREYALFLAATALIVAHILNDEFLSREPGTSAGDHVLGAAVPIVVALLTAIFYPTVRGGVRGWIAILFGILALTRAVVALLEASSVGLSGDDYTGILLLPAGTVLIAVGAWTLWRSRKTSGSRVRRLLRRALIGFVVVVVGLEVVFPLAYAIFYTHKPRMEVERANLGRPYEEVTLQTSDGLDLAAWYVPSRNGAAVIAFPGRSGPVPHARMLARHGYGVLLLDMRGQGESEGVSTGLWDSSKDLAAAVAFLQDRPDVEGARIGGIGLSQGGEQLIQAAAENPGLRAVVSDGAGIRSVREAVLRGGVVNRITLPVYALSSAAMAVLSGDAPPPAVKDLVPRVSPRPLFLIYAGQGAGGEDLNPTYFRAAGEPKQLWEIPEASHTGGLAARPKEYEHRVVAFFDRALLEGT